MLEMSATTSLMSACVTLPMEPMQKGGGMPKPKVLLKPFTLRLPEELYKALERIAETELRPVNSQMVVFLRQSVARWHEEQQATTKQEG